VVNTHKNGFILNTYRNNWNVSGGWKDLKRCPNQPDIPTCHSLKVFPLSCAHHSAWRGKEKFIYTEIAFLRRINRERTLLQNRPKNVNLSFTLINTNANEPNVASSLSAGGLVTTRWRTTSTRVVSGTTAANTEEWKKEGCMWSPSTGCMLYVSHNCKLSLWAWSLTQTCGTWLLSYLVVLFGVFPSIWGYKSHPRALDTIQASTFA